MQLCINATFWSAILFGLLLHGVEAFHLSKGLSLSHLKICRLHIALPNSLRMPSYLTDMKTIAEPILINDFDRIFEGLQAHKTIFGDLDIHVNFSIPFEPPWPENLYGMGLGSLLNSMLNGTNFTTEYPEKAQMLSDLGFNFTSSLKTDWDIIIDALKAYKQIYHNLKINRRFVVPSDGQEWPRLSRGLKLGINIFALSLGLYVSNNPERAQQLKQLGVPVMPGSQYHKLLVDVPYLKKVVIALQLYKSLHNKNVPKSFKVPRKDPWPFELRGMNLGYICESFRNQQEELRIVNPKFAKLLDAMSFPWVIPNAREISLNKTLEALVEYKRRTGNVDVHRTFSIPRTPDWPEQFRGFKLGERVESIRQV